MKRTALYDIHVALQAKMVPFAGYIMPVSYAGVTSEHLAVRQGVGVFDVSHMGEFLISGPHALALLQKITANDVAQLDVGKAQYSYMPNEQNGIVDDLIVYKIDEEKYLLVVNAANIQKDWDWIERHNTMQAVVRNLSDAYSLLAIQGPKAIEAMQSLTSIALDELPYYSFRVGDFAGIDHVIISATGYTGSGGIEVYCKNSEVTQVWESVFKAGEAYGIQPIGLAARDTLRLEMGYCLYGNDITEQTSPIAAGLSWITKFSKPFINYEALALAKKQGTPQKLVGFVLQEKGIPRKDYELVDQNGTVIGHVTSGTMSPSLQQGIGLGYVNTSFSTIGTTFFVNIRKKSIPATVVKLPFYKK